MHADATVAGRWVSYWWFNTCEFLIDLPSSKSRPLVLVLGKKNISSLWSADWVMKCWACVSSLADLCVVQMVRAFTQGMAQVDPQKGGRFSLFNGNVVGEFSELVSFFKYLFLNLWKKLYMSFPLCWCLFFDSTEFNVVGEESSVFILNTTKHGPEKKQYTLSCRRSRRYLQYLATVCKSS